MEVKEVENMPKILEGYKPIVTDEKTSMSDKSKEFVKVTMLHEELDREKEKLFQELDSEEKKDAFSVISKKFSIPEYISVRDASEILGITPQMVRRHCSNGKIIGHQTLEGSGKWRIATEQFMGKPNWNKFIEKRAKIRDQSINIAEKALEYLNDME